MMTEFFIDGEKVENKEAFVRALNVAQEVMVEQEKNIAETFEVSPDTASAIFYLRTRSRWTWDKERELIDRDHAGDPISLGAVLSGEF
jgi:hypothetical protein